VPERIVEVLEMVQIEHDHAQCLAGSNGAMYFPFERFFQIAAIEEARHGISNGLVSQCLA
jgi:hypothetical protein